MSEISPRIETFFIKIGWKKRQELTIINIRIAFTNAKIKALTKFSTKEFMLYVEDRGR